MVRSFVASVNYALSPGLLKSNLMKSAPLSNWIISPAVTMGPIPNSINVPFEEANIILEYKKGKSITIGYIGVIGQQEGIDHLLKAIKFLITKLKYKDFHCYIIGDGPSK